MPNKVIEIPLEVFLKKKKQSWQMTSQSTTELCDKSVTRSFTAVLISLAYLLSLTDTQVMEE